MSTSSFLGLNLATIRTSLPLITVGIMGGLYSLMVPSEGAKLFGTPFENPLSPSPAEIAYAKMHGVRKFATALVALRLISYAGELDAQGHAVAAKAIGNAVGTLLFAGTVVALGEAWACNRYAKRTGVKAENKEWALNLGTWHLIKAGPIALLGMAWFRI
ncbi:hypothetical protein LTR70_008800 [Exophiala xenobiotica]|uniref:DUF4149 domain-containing protein n=1 Tax=Lithohypha guttulata TaxID=1690604 RepID=A0ABR0JZC7_9EURO|nr:hypothetical protein LTR24_008665 [Lithohypha guttulata]KAK5311439.1 hypothetical protein LTR70_008800 [Exophiala xenobiotica]